MCSDVHEVPFCVYLHQSWTATKRLRTDYIHLLVTADVEGGGGLGFIPEWGLTGILYYPYFQSAGALRLAFVKCYVTKYSWYPVGLGKQHHCIVTAVLTDNAVARSKQKDEQCSSDGKHEGGSVAANQVTWHSSPEVLLLYSDTGLTYDLESDQGTDIKSSLKKADGSVHTQLLAALSIDDSINISNTTGSPVHSISLNSFHPVPLPLPATLPQRPFLIDFLPTVEESAWHPWSFQMLRQVLAGPLVSKRAYSEKHLITFVKFSWIFNDFVPSGLAATQTVWCGPFEQMWLKVSKHPAS